MNQALLIKEIFSSIQGEGGRAGAPSIFIRLAKCNKNCSFCDTDWSEGEVWSINQIHDYISRFDPYWIVWTGGEPTMQLTNGVIECFPEYMHAIETNGSLPVPSEIDYIAVSPKEGVTSETLRKNFPLRKENKTDFWDHRVNEYRYAYGVGMEEPPDVMLLPKATHYYVSPIFTGPYHMTIDETNLQMCLDFIMKNPIWKLSLQLHKLIKVR
jgi:7-carboxy-7-deazaguanine synthase